MKKQIRWQEKLLARNYGLGPLTFSDHIEQRLREEIPEAEFKRRMETELEMYRLDSALRSSTIEWLYEIALQVRVEQETFGHAARLLPTKGRQIKTDQLLKLLHGLQKSPHIANQVRASRKAKRLTNELRAMVDIFNLWKDYAEVTTLRPALKNQLAFVERQLKRKHWSHLKFKYQRLGLIQAMLRAMKVKNMDEEALARSLRPSRLKKAGGKKK